MSLLVFVSSHKFWLPWTWCHRSGPFGRKNVKNGDRIVFAKNKVERWWKQNRGWHLVGKISSKKWRWVAKYFLTIARWTSDSRVFEKIACRVLQFYQYNNIGRQQHDAVTEISGSWDGIHLRNLIFLLFVLRQAICIAFQSHISVRWRFPTI